MALVRTFDRAILPIPLLGLSNSKIPTTKRSTADSEPTIRMKGSGMLALIRMILVGLVAIEHGYFLYLEMFAWTTPRVQRIFGTTAEFAQQSSTLAANQGLYNGFLAAGLIWGLVHPNPNVGLQIQLFFLACILVAGIYGGITVKSSILIVQGIPALLAGLVVVIAFFTQTSA